MITYPRDPHSVVPPSHVKIIGLGGAGSNMLERIALDGNDPSELLVLNTDVRTLESCLARQKIQLGRNLTKGLGTGGDPELGQQAVLEAESELRDGLRGCRIVFLCVGLGGGTGSGAAPIVTRIAREEGAFVVVFATMPFAFEGRRRRSQAETALNELAVLSNALVTFDNNRMGELILAKQGIHEAFVAADRMIGASIRAVIRLVTRPGLVHVGLDDLMSALRATRSRCLFGSGIAEGKDRAAKALRNALASPLLDQGALLKEASTVLVHLCGGESLTLFEVELLMQQLQKFVPDQAQILFGAAVDPAMGDSLSLTLISSLPEDSLAMAPRESLSPAAAVSTDIALEPAQGFTPEPVEEPAPAEPVEVEPIAPPSPATAPAKVSHVPPPRRQRVQTISTPAREPAPAAPLAPAAQAAPAPRPALVPVEPTLSLFDDDTPPFAEPETKAPADPAPTRTVVAEFFTLTEDKPKDPTPTSTATPDDDVFSDDLADTGFSDAVSEPAPVTSPPPWEEPTPPADPTPAPASQPAADTPKLKLGIKPTGPRSELGLESSPRGRFEGESPNMVDGEDLDLPPFLRKKK